GEVLGQQPRDARAIESVGDVVEHYAVGRKHSDDRAGEVPTHLSRLCKADGVDGSRSRHLSAKVWLLSKRPRVGATHMEITTIGLDLAKSIFQVHAVDAAGEPVVRKTLRRAQVLPFFAKLPPCLVGMEACGT